MKPFRVFLIAVVVVALLCTGIATAVDLVGAFQIEHAAGWKRIEDVYSRIELTEERQEPDRVRDGKKPISISYMGDGARHRMDVETPEFGLRVSVATAATSFRLEKTLGQAEFVVKDVNRHNFVNNLEGMRERGGLSFAPFSIMNMRLIDFSTLPRFETVGYEVVKIDDEELLKLNWRSPHTYEGESSTRVGWFLFLPRSWALREYEFRYSEDAFGCVRALIEYEGEHEGVPLVKSLRQWAERRDGSTEPRMTSRVVRLSTSPPASEKFTLAAFNLPNDLGESVKPHAGRLWMILVGLVGLVLSWLLAAWVRRRNASIS